MERADTIELKTGERVEGAFQQATAAGAVIEVAGQAITIPLEKLKAIYFGAVPAASAGIPPPPYALSSPANAEVPTPFQSALEALKDLRLLWKAGSGLGYDAVVNRLLDIKVKVDKYLTSEPKDTEAGHALRAAMLDYDLIRMTFSPEKEMLLSNIAEIITDSDVATCPAFKNLTDASLKGGQPVLKSLYRQNAETKHRQLGQNYIFTDADNLALNYLVSPVFSIVTDCAAENITRAERIAATVKFKPSAAPLAKPEKPQPTMPPQQNAPTASQKASLLITGSEVSDGEKKREVQKKR